MKPSELLRIIGKPIAYYPQLAKPLGGVNASLLFGHFFYWNDKGRSELGVYRTADEIEVETGLSRDEQRTARRKLRERGVLIETEKRIEHRIYYKLDLDRFDEIISQSGSGDFPIADSDIPNPEVGNSQSGSGDFPIADSDIPNPEVGNSQSGSGDFPIDEVGNSQSYIRTEDYQKTTTVDYYNNNAPANADACVESVATAKPKKPTLAKQRKQDALQLLADHGVDGQLALDYLAVREDRKARTLTQTAIAGLEREAVRAGLTLAQAVTVCVERNWAGFNADWLHSSGQQGFRPQPARQSVKQIPQHTQGGAFLAKDIL
jgi:hypothetical protein